MLVQAGEGLGLASVGTLVIPAYWCIWKIYIYCSKSETVAVCLGYVEDNYNVKSKLQLHWMLTYPFDKENIWKIWIEEYLTNLTNPANLKIRWVGLYGGIVCKSAITEQKISKFTKRLASWSKQGAFLWGKKVKWVMWLRNAGVNKYVVK